MATADNHLSRYYPRLPPSRLEERRARLRAGFEAAVTYAIEQRASLFLQAGDLFDSPSPTNADVDFVAQCLQRLHAAGVPVCAVGGNHDTPSGRNVQGGVAPLAPLASLDGLSFFGSPELESRAYSLDGLTVCVGGATPTPGPAAIDPLEALHSPAGDEVDIFLTHGAIKGHSFPGAREPVLQLETAARLPNLKLAVAGHIHKHSVERAGGALLVAPGATEWLTFGETGAQPGFVTLRYDGERITDFQHVSVEPQPRVQLEVDLETVDGDPYEAILQVVAGSSSVNTLMKLVLRGAVTREQYVTLRLRELQERGAALCFAFDLDATGLYLREEFAVQAARGVRVSQEAEIDGVAAELIAAAETSRESILLAATRDELLSHYP